MDTDTDDVLRPANKALTIHPVAMFLERDVVVFRHQERRIVPTVIEVRDAHSCDLPGVESFSELSVETAFARSEDGSGGKPCVLRIDFLWSKKKVFYVRYASQLGSEVFYFGIERFGRGIG